MKIINSLLLFGLFFLNIALGSIDREFKDFYYSSKIDPRFCGKNISNFTKHLSSKNLFKESFRVIKMTSPSNPWSFGNIIAVNGRWGSLNNKNYVIAYGHHVFLIYDNKVYDFSFNDEPKILSIPKYFKEMFIPVKAFLIHGKDFRTRGKGPYYSPQDALDELNDSYFNFYSTDTRGDHHLIEQDLTYTELDQLL